MKKLLLTSLCAVCFWACGDDSSNPSNNGGISEQDIIIKTACGNIYSDMTFRNEGGDVLGNFNQSNNNIVLIDESVYELNKTDILEDSSYACPIKESVLDSLEEIISKNSSSSNKVGSSSSEKELSSSSQKAVSSSSQILFSSSGAIVSKLTWQDMNPDIEYGLFTDERDGQYYRTVQIGDQIWMAENLNYETEGSHCYDEESTNCEKYGRLYTWDAAMNSCPAGFHLPSEDEWIEFIQIVGRTGHTGTNLKSKTGWVTLKDLPAGNDKYGFNGLPGGLREYDGAYGSMGYGYFWTSTTGICFYLYYGSEFFSRINNTSDTNASSVRCIKNAE